MNFTPVSPGWVVEITIVDEDRKEESRELFAEHLVGYFQDQKGEFHPIISNYPTGFSTVEQLVDSFDDSILLGYRVLPADRLSEKVEILD